MQTVPETTRNFRIDCHYCDKPTKPSELVICPHCECVIYCSDDCRKQDYKSSHSSMLPHKAWCEFMKSFKLLNVVLSEFTFDYTKVTTHRQFSRVSLTKILAELGVSGVGLWKYLFHTTGNGPGEELSEYTGLIFDGNIPVGANSGEVLQAAIEKAYGSSEGLNLYLHYSSTYNSYQPGEIVSDCLTSWSDFYEKLCLTDSSPLAMLFHWPLTVYEILKDKLLARRIGSKNSLSIHLIGAETEVDLLPTFKELDYLIAPTFSELTITMVGPNISPHASNKTWFLSNRLSVCVWSGLYHTFIETESTAGRPQTPDVVIGLNAGLMAYWTWRETLELVKSMKAPAYFTDLCPLSAACSLQVLHSLGMAPAVRVEDPGSVWDLVRINPFRSPLRVDANSGCLLQRYSNALIFSVTMPPDAESSAPSLEHG